MCRRANACCNCNKIYCFSTTQHRISSLTSIYYSLTCDGRQWDLDESLENIISASQFRPTANILICSKVQNSSLIAHRICSSTPKFCMNETFCVLVGFSRINLFGATFNSNDYASLIFGQWKTPLKIISIRKCCRANNENVIHVFIMNFMVDEKWLTYFTS